MKFNLKQFFLILFLFLLSTQILFADKHSEKEVLSLIKDVQEKLDALNETSADIYAGKEIAQIAKFIKNAKMQLEDGEEDLAFYEISKGRAIFKLIDAKMELMNAEIELKNARSND